MEQDIMAQFLEREREREEEVGNSEDSLENAGIIATFFKKVLSPEELADIYLSALHGLPENTACNTEAAVCVERALHGDPSVALGKAPEIIRFMHGNLDDITNRHARTHATGVLQELQDHRLSEVAYTLLSWSPQCDSSAATLWRMLVDRNRSAAEVLEHLMACLQGQPLKPHLTAEEAAPLRVAAAHVLPALMDQPLLSLRLALEDQWEAVCLAWVFWMSHLHRGVQEIPLSPVLESAEPAPEELVKSAAGTLQKLLGQVRPELLPKASNIWPLLENAESFHSGVTLFFRALNISLPSREGQQVVDHLAAVLHGHEEYQQVTAMAILAELLQTSDSTIPEDTFHLLMGQLSSPNAAIHSLALDGLHHLADKPQQVWKLLPLLPEAAKTLQEPDEQKAQRLFGQLHHCLAQTTDPSLAVAAAGRLVPLFHAESPQARAFGFDAFGTMLRRGATERAVKDLALSSLVPLLLHLHDENIDVIEACWDTLRTVAVLLGHEKLRWLIPKRDSWAVWLIIVKRFRKVPKCRFLQQILEHLRSPQANIREAAVKILGLVGQQTKDQRKMTIIYQALRDMRGDKDPSIGTLALHTVDILEAMNEGVSPCWSLWERLRRRLRGCCSPAEDDMVTERIRKISAWHSLTVASEKG
uniref:maestro heat-like repeat-containing protein family member 7 n=1 Tax=Euleptes europaea TaxID=460621 RepID=UPI002540F5F5|nr:maestro heat-like repeat-containing protein family member 7 [Euleptes europaea]